MSPLYFALGCLVGLLAGAAASNIDGPAPAYVFGIAGAMTVVVAVVIWIIGKDERGR